MASSRYRVLWGLFPASVLLTGLAWVVVVELDSSRPEPFHDVQAPVLGRTDGREPRRQAVRTVKQPVEVPAARADGPVDADVEVSSKLRAPNVENELGWSDRLAVALVEAGCQVKEGESESTITDEQARSICTALEYVMGILPGAFPVDMEDPSSLIRTISERVVRSLSTRLSEGKSCLQLEISPLLKDDLQFRIQLNGANSKLGRRLCIHRGKWRIMVEFSEVEQGDAEDFDGYQLDQH